MELNSKTLEDIILTASISLDDLNHQPEQHTVLVMHFKHLNITQECLRCSFLNPKAEDSFRCHCQGSCPAFLSEEDKEYILNNWDPVEEVCIDAIEQLYAKCIDELICESDKRILEEMRNECS